MENYPFYWTYANYCYAIFNQAEVMAEQSRAEQSRAYITIVRSYRYIPAPIFRPSLASHAAPPQGKRN